MMQMFFWNSLAFSMIHRMLTVWSLVPLPFLNPAWISGSSRLTYCWSLAWRILSITLLACEMSEIVWSFEHLWHCLCLGWEWKLTYPSPVATSEFSKFAGILSIALKEETVGPGLHRRPVQCWPCLATFSVDLELCAQCLWKRHTNRKIRPSPDKGTLRVVSRLLIT